MCKYCRAGERTLLHGVSESTVEQILKFEKCGNQLIAQNKKVAGDGKKVFNLMKIIEELRYKRLCSGHT